MEEDTSLETLLQDVGPLVWRTVGTIVGKRGFAFPCDALYYPAWSPVSDSNGRVKPAALKADPKPSHISNRGNGP